MEIRVSTAPRLQQLIAEGHQRSEIAMTRAIGAAGRGLQAELRAQVVTAGLGRRLGQTWRLGLYPAAGASLDAAAVVATRAPHLIRAFQEGAVIRSASGFWLAIPSDMAPKRGLGGKRISPTNFPEHVYGALRFVYRRPPAPSMLVVDNQRMTRTGRLRLAQAPGQYPANWTKSRRQTRVETGAGRVTVPMFFLFPQVKLRKRLDVTGAAEGWRAAIPALFGRELAAVARAETRR